MVSRPRSAAFTVRAWLEGEMFRARVTYSQPGSSEPLPDVHLATADPADVIEHLASWLHAIADRTAGTPDQ